MEVALSVSILDSVETTYEHLPDVETELQWICMAADSQFDTEYERYSPHREPCWLLFRAFVKETHSVATYMAFKKKCWEVLNSFT